MKLSARLLLASAEQSRKLDQKTINDLGIRGDTLMEIAGFGAAEWIMRHLSPGQAVLFVLGKGNNAGDGLVTARILLDKGIPVKLFPVFGTDSFSSDARLNYERLLYISEALQKKLVVWDQWHSDKDISVIVDAIFGTGFQRAIRAPLSEIIEQINDSGKKIFSFDIPSGLNCDTGASEGAVIRADVTLFFGVRKLGAYLESGPSLCGERVLIPLPFPDSFQNNITIRLFNEDMDPLHALQRPVHGAQRDQPPPDSRDFFTPETATEVPVQVTSSSDALHKYSNGVVHVIGGSPGLAGAPLYAGKAAWSLGMGAVTLIHPATCRNALNSMAPELIKVSVGSPENDSFTPQDAESVLSYLHEKPGVVVLGPGIGRKKETMDFVRILLQQCHLPLIIDADGLRSIRESDHPLVRKRNAEILVLTPHPGELAAITGDPIQKDALRLQTIRNLSLKFSCTVVSKGSPAMIRSCSTDETLLSGYDTKIFARAGFGDVLAGHLAAFLARTADPVKSSEYAMICGYKKISACLSAGNLFPEPSDLL